MKFGAFPTAGGKAPSMCEAEFEHYRRLSHVKLHIAKLMIIQVRKHFVILFVQTCTLKFSILKIFRIRNWFGFKFGKHQD